MQTLSQPELLRQTLRQIRQQGKRIALVPTMGNLHQGHLKLVEVARQHADYVVVSIFVNPMQFDRPDDLARYPRTLPADKQLLARQATDILFAPEVQSLYPAGLATQTTVQVPGLSDQLEGASRPGHFHGVTTIVSKLFNLVQPDVACFGEKDFQQLAIIRKMVSDLAYGIEIIGVPTERADDGLALSSRNGYLSEQQRQQAPLLNQVMRNMAERLRQQPTASQAIIADAEAQLLAVGWRPDGIAICDADSLLPLEKHSQQAVVLMAAWLGQARLIDNQRVSLR